MLPQLLAQRLKGRQTRSLTVQQGQAQVRTMWHQMSLRNQSQWRQVLLLVLQTTKIQSLSLLELLYC